MRIFININTIGDNHDLRSRRNVSLDLPDDAVYGAEKPVAALVESAIAAAIEEYIENIDEYMDKITQEATNE